jgi:hypothetical protein
MYSRRCEVSCVSSSDKLPEQKAMLDGIETTDRCIRRIIPYFLSSGNAFVILYILVTHAILLFQTSKSLCDFKINPHFTQLTNIY